MQKSSPCKLNQMSSSIAAPEATFRAEANNHQRCQSCPRHLPFFQLCYRRCFRGWRPSFSLSFAQLGTLASLFYLVSALGQAAAGFIVDRVGARVVMFGGLTLVCRCGVDRRDGGRLRPAGRCAQSAWHRQLAVSSGRFQHHQPAHLERAYRPRLQCARPEWHAGLCLGDLCHGDAGAGVWLALCAGQRSRLRPRRARRRGDFHATRSTPVTPSYATAAAAAGGGRHRAASSFGFLRHPVVWLCFSHSSSSLPSAIQRSRTSRRQHCRQRPVSLTLAPPR